MAPTPERNNTERQALSVRNLSVLGSKVGVESTREKSVGRIRSAVDDSDEKRLVASRDRTLDDC